MANENDPILPSTNGNGAPGAPPISSKELHRICRRAFRINNRSRLKLILAILVLSDGKLFLELGYSSIFQYTERNFGYGRTKTFESLRVARALPSLPRCRMLFEEGDLCWSTVRLITRVATAETEKEWIDYAGKHTYKQLKCEVEEAAKQKRARPRKDGYGLANLEVKVHFDLTLEEHSMVTKALEKTAAEMRGSMGEEGGEAPPVSQKAALLYICERILSTDLPDAMEKRAEKEETPFSILYQLCPRCREKATVATDEGRVAVPAEHAKRIEGEARKVEIRPEEERRESGEHADCGGDHEIDRPNTPALARKVKLRDGLVCTNPFCRRKSGLHAHHVKYRWMSGRTALWNETTVCVTCHLLLHLGLLVIDEKEDGSYEWIRCSDGLVLDPLEEEKDLAGVPTVIAEYTTANAASAAAGADGTSGGDGAATARGAERILRALLGAGFPRWNAEARLRDARKLLLSEGNAQPTEADLWRAIERGAPPEPESAGK